MIKVVWQHAKMYRRKVFALGFKTSLSYYSYIVNLFFKIAQVKIYKTELILNLTNFGSNDLLINFLTGLFLSFITLYIVPQCTILTKEVVKNLSFKNIPLIAICNYQVLNLTIIPLFLLLHVIENKLIEALTVKITFMRHLRQITRGLHFHQNPWILTTRSIDSLIYFFTSINKIRLVIERMRKEIMYYCFVIFFILFIIQFG